MFREMRRAKQALAPETCEEILRTGSSGILALAGDDGYPYALPISYLYEGGKFYFHSAVAGHKLDAIRRCDKASFCVVDQDQVVPEKYTTLFRSVIAFGRIRILEEGPEFMAAMDALARKYVPADSEEHRAATIEGALPRLCMIVLEPEHITGKQHVNMV